MYTVSQQSELQILHKQTVQIVTHSGAMPGVVTRSQAKRQKTELHRMRERLQAPVTCQFTTLKEADKVYKHLADHLTVPAFVEIAFEYLGDVFCSHWTCLRNHHYDWRFDKFLSVANEQCDTIKLVPNHNSLPTWTALMPGPPGSLYEGGIFRLKVEFDSFEKLKEGGNWRILPKAVFQTQIFHPNVTTDGKVVIQKSSPLSTVPLWSLGGNAIINFLMSVQQILAEPNFEEVIRSTQAVSVWKEDRTKAEHKARDMTKTYAMNPNDKVYYKIIGPEGVRLPNFC